MAHYDDLFPGRFLKGTTIADHPLTIRIVSIGGEILEGDDGEKAKGILRYRTRGPNGDTVNGELVLAKTNAVLMAAIFGTPDYHAWAGRLVTVGFDPTVMFGKEKVGGIRVVGSPELTKTITVNVKRPRRKNPERYVLKPTGKAAPVAEPTPAPDAPASEDGAA